MTEVLDWILKRRSIRTYADSSVSSEQVEMILRAALSALSANDIRPWAFVVVRDVERRQALSKVHQWSSMCANAPLVIAVIGDPEASQQWVEDCSAATENLLLAVTGMELGAVWVGIYPNIDNETKVRQILDIPEQFRVLCLVPVGRPAEAKPPRTRYEESNVHDETFGNRTNAG